MLVSCSNPNCTLQFSDSLTACPSCGHGPAAPVELPKITYSNSESILDPLDSLQIAFLPNRSNCPKCACTQSISASTKAWFFVKRPRRCEWCQTAFMPPINRFFAFIMICVGLGLVFGGAMAGYYAFVKGQLSMFSSTILVPVGFLTSIYGWRFLKHRSTQ